MLKFDQFRSVDDFESIKKQLDQAKIDMDQLIDDLGQLNLRKKRNSLTFSDDVNILIELYESCSKRAFEFDKNFRIKNELERESEKQLEIDLECLDRKFKYLNEKFSTFAKYFDYFNLIRQSTITSIEINRESNELFSVEKIESIIRQYHVSLLLFY